VAAALTLITHWFFFSFLLLLLLPLLFSVCFHFCLFLRYIFNFMCEGPFAIFSLQGLNTFLVSIMFISFGFIICVVYCRNRSCASFRLIASVFFFILLLSCNNNANKMKYTCWNRRILF